MIVADRELVESGSDDILEGAKDVDVAFLVVGDPFGYVYFIIIHSFSPFAYMAQGDYTYRPSAAGSRARNTDENDPQCINHVCHRLYRLAAV